MSIRSSRTRTVVPTLLALEDRSVPAAFAAGSVQGQDGWSGGNMAIAPQVDQRVDQSGALAHTGVGSFVASNNTANGNYNGNFSGWVFGPGLATPAGQPASGAPANLFTATLWFRSVSNAADGSNLELDLGSSAGDDRATFVAITNRLDADGGLQLRIGEPDGATGNFFPTLSPVTNITRGAWHRIDITAKFVDGSANDTFSVKFDGAAVVNSRTGGTDFGTFEGYFEGVGGPYAQTNRLYFRSGAAPSAYSPSFSDTAAQGFAFDDLSYTSATQAAPGTTLAYYAATFEPVEVQVSGLAVTVSDGKTTATAGASNTYAITVSNSGPAAVTGATLSVALPADLTGVTYTSVVSGGATGNTNGTGAPADALNLPVGATVTYIVTGTVSPAAVGSLSVTATITNPVANTFDPNTTDNTSTDTDAVFVPDTTRPTPNLTVVGSFTAQSPTTVVVNFTEPVTGFTADDLVVAGGTVSGFSGSGANYSFTFTPAAAGQVQIVVPNGSAQDAAGNLSTGTSGLFVAGAAPVLVVVAPPPVRVVPAPTPSPRIAVGADGVVRVYNPADGTSRDFAAFPGFNGPVATALADLDGDGVLDLVVAAGAGGSPHVKVINGATGATDASFFAYSPAFTGGVYVAASSDGRIVVGAGTGGGPNVKVFDRTGNLLQSFFAYGTGFTGGVRVAIGDVNGDGAADIVTGTGPGGAPHVKVFDANTGALEASFFAFNPGVFTGGVFVSAANGVIGVGADAGGGPNVKVFDGAGNLRGSAFAYAQSFSGGVRVAFADTDGDGTPDLITGPGPGGGVQVKAFRLSDLAAVRSFVAADLSNASGVLVG